jgi:predicted nuclease of predicted toxin-antitoxin system
MKLLFDQNLSPRLVSMLSDQYPGCAHVEAHALDQATDEAVWMFARTHGYTLVTKDSDFHELSLLRGAPPKVVWIRREIDATRRGLASVRFCSATARPIPLIPPPTIATSGSQPCAILGDGALEHRRRNGAFQRSVACLQSARGIPVGSVRAALLPKPHHFSSCFFVPSAASSELAGTPANGRHLC